MIMWSFRAPQILARSRAAVQRSCSRRPSSSPSSLYLSRRHASSDSTNITRIGFIGLGNMGLPMALNLSKESSVLAFDTNPVACDTAAQGGIELADSVQHIGASDCHVIFTMLPSCSVVDSVMQSLLESIPESSLSRVMVDCSTVSPSTSRRWHDTWKSQGHAMLDAPVSGGVKGATDGTLTFMVGCDHDDALQRAQPFLNNMGQRVVPCGGPGAGAATKLCNNLALAAQMIGICEAMNLGEALDVDPVVLAEVINTSTAKCWSSEVSNPHPAVAAAKAASGVDSPASRDYEGGFGVALMLKDLGLAVASAQDAGVALPMTATSKELYKMTELRGAGHKDFGYMLQFLKGK